MTFLDNGPENYYGRLKDMREDHDYTQDKVSTFLGMKQPQYSRYERGIRDTPTHVIIQLAQFYHTSTDYLLGLTDDPDPHSSKVDHKKD